MQEEFYNINSIIEAIEVIENFFDFFLFDNEKNQLIIDNEALIVYGENEDKIAWVCYNADYHAVYIRDF